MYVVYVPSKRALWHLEKAETCWSHRQSLRPKNPSWCAVPDCSWASLSTGCAVRVKLEVCGLDMVSRLHGKVSSTRGDGLVGSWVLLGWCWAGSGPHHPCKASVPPSIHPSIPPCAGAGAPLGAEPRDPLGAGTQQDVSVPYSNSVCDGLGESERCSPFPMLRSPRWRQPPRVARIF